jgi:trimeric autotransporter adhesin
VGSLRIAETNGPGRRVSVLAVLVSAVMAVGGQAAAVAGHPGGVRTLRARSAQAGVMATAAGGAGGPATGTRVILPGACGVSFGRGRVYVADGSTVRRVNPRTGWLTTPAGFPADPEPLGDGGPAVSAFLHNACGATVDHAGDLVIADTGGNRIRLVAKRTGRLSGRAVTAGDIYTVAGDGRAGYSGNDGPARKATLDNPSGVAVDAAGNLVVADTDNQVVRVVAARTGTFYGQAMTAGDIYTVAGDGGAGYSGNDGPATAAELHSPGSVAVDGAGNLLIADTGNHRLRVVAARTGTFYGQAMTAGDIYTVAGRQAELLSGLGGTATAAQFISGRSYPGVRNVAVDLAGNVVFSTPSTARVLVVARASGTFYGRAMTAGHLYSIAGDGRIGFGGDGGPATRAELMYPSGLGVDAAGNVLICDSQNGRIRVVAEKSGRFYGQAMTAGDIYTIAGGGGGGDGGPAVGAELSLPSAVTVDSSGNVLIAASGDNSIRVVAEKSGRFYGQAMTAGDIYTIVTGLNFPEGVAVDSFGNVVIGDPYIQVIQVLAEATGTFYGIAMTAGHLYAVAGTGTAGYSGDGGPATAAQINSPNGIGVDNAGNLIIIPDSGNNRIRVVPDTSGTFYGITMTAGHIYTVAGDGTEGCAGDGGPATAAELDFPVVATPTAAGGLAIADGGCNEIRRVTG